MHSSLFNRYFSPQAFLKNTFLETVVSCHQASLMNAHDLGLGCKDNDKRKERSLMERQLWDGWKKQEEWMPEVEMKEQQEGRDGEKWGEKWLWLPGAPGWLLLCSPSLVLTCNLAQWVSLRVCEPWMGFKAGDESFVSSFSLHPLPRVSAHPERRNFYLGLCWKSPLELALPWTQDLLGEQFNNPLSSKQRSLWWMEICAKRTYIEAFIVCQVAIHECEPPDLCSLLPALGTPFTSQLWTQMQ